MPNHLAAARNQPQNRGGSARHPLGLFFSLTFLLAGLLTGCRLWEPNTSSFASVLIHNHTHEEIVVATAQVFREDGYAGTLPELRQMVFEKPATRGQNIARAGIVGTHYGEQTLVRVRVNMVDLGGGSYRLDAQTYMVNGAGGDPFFENEVRLAHFRAGPYQKLLDKAAERLKAPDEKPQ